MPLEVTPIPFANQQLPYTPKFIPPEIDGMPDGMQSGIRGPASAAASALIPPTPGGVAGPHRAIPALPDAGYTAPTLRAASLAGAHPADRAPPFVSANGRAPPNAGGYGDAKYAASMYGGPRDRTVYAGGSMYDGYAPASSYCGMDGYAARQAHSPRLPTPAPLSAIYSEGWAASSLPSPRRPGARMGPMGPALPPIDTESAIAPRHRHHSQEPDDVDYQHGGHHHHHHHHAQSPSSDHHHHRSHSPSGEPHLHHHREDHHRHHSRSVVNDDGMSDASYYAKPKLHRRRSDSMSSASEMSSPQEGMHRRSPSASHHHSQSLHQQSHRSPSLGPPQSHGHSHSPISPSPLARPAKEVYSPLSPKGGRSRAASAEVEDHHHSGEERDDRGGERARTRRVSNLRDIESLSDSESTVTKRREKSRSDHHHRAHHHRHSSSGHNAEVPISPRHHVHAHGHETPQGRSSHHRHHHSSSLVDSPTLPPAAPSTYLGAPPPLEPPRGTRRRAVSLQGYDGSPMLGQHGGHMPYAAPSVAGVGPVDMYDDGGSIAGSAMTFMDGAVGGRVSQYGLPKYPHQPKMDYRRFCVQRGNADVFLD